MWLIITAKEAYSIQNVEEKDFFDDSDHESAIRSDNPFNKESLVL